MSAKDIQVGGSHYKDWAIQPIEFITKNNIPFIEGNIIKYACRWREKNGREDLEKIKHYVDLLIELEGSTWDDTPQHSAYERWREIEQENLRGYFGIWK
jgi:hypothetical protein